MFDFKNYRNPALFFIEEIVLVVLFFALVIEKPLMNALIIRRSCRCRGFRDSLADGAGLEAVWTDQDE